MTLDVRLLGPADVSLFDRVAPDVFDGPIDELLTVEFLADPRHHIAAAIDDDVIVGMASAVHHVHPDKVAQLWINEVGVAPTHRARGIGRRLLDCLIQLASDLECSEAWVLTERTNTAAQRLYESVGGIVPPEDCVMYTIPVA